MPKDEYSDNKKQFWSKEEAVLNIQKYCAFQERCHKEVRYKLIEHAIYGDLLEEIISPFIINGFATCSSTGDPKDFKISLTTS